MFLKRVTITVYWRLQWTRRQLSRTERIEVGIQVNYCNVFFSNGNQFNSNNKWTACSLEKNKTAKMSNGHVNTLMRTPLISENRHDSPVRWTFDMEYLRQIRQWESRPEVLCLLTKLPQPSALFIWFICRFGRLHRICTAVHSTRLFNFSVSHP